MSFPCLVACSADTRSDVRTGRAMFPATSVEHLIPDEGVRKAGEHALDVRANGVPLLVTSEPAAHAYDPSLQAWIPLITPWQLAYPSTERRAAKESVKGPLSEVEARVHDIWAQDRSRSQAFPASDIAQLDWWSETREINYWEARMRGAELLESPAEYRQAVGKLAQLFAREGFAARAEELLKDLTGPIFRYVHHPTSSHQGTCADWSQQNEQFIVPARCRFFAEDGPSQGCPRSLQYVTYSIASDFTRC